jgi:hypothetical protein
MKHFNRIVEAQLEVQRFQATQASREQAALNGALGIDAQLLAMSEIYKDLRNAGRIDEALAVRAEAFRLKAAQS